MKIAGLILALTFAITMPSKGQVLSNQAGISVLTLGPEQAEVYLAFGHSAIRVHDPENGWDLVYNYGVFDFDQPNFYLNFALAKPYYKLGVHSYRRFRAAYIEENRTIIEQTLNLDSAERQKFFAYLQWNAKPENASYYYNYLFDNCATKIRDVMDTIYDGRINYDYSFVKEELSFRDLMDLYLGEQPWGDLGIDLCLGTGIDIIAPGHDYMFLPDYIEKSLDGAVITTDDGSKPLVSSKEVVYQATPQPTTASAITPQMAFIGVFLLLGFITFKDLKRGKRSAWVDMLLFSVVGLVGWLLFFLWFFSEHISQNNFNLMWALPTHLPLIFFTFSERLKPYLKYYFLVSALLSAVLITFWGFWPQNMHDSLIPIALILLIRSFMIWKESAN